MDSKVHIIGIGPGARESLSSRTEAIIAKAQLLVCGQRFLDMFPETAAEKLVLRANLAEVVETIKRESHSRRVVVLASGDPNCFGIAKRLIDEIGKDRIEIIPNIGAVQLAFARIKESWDDAVPVSAHGRPVEDIIPTVHENRKIAILTDRKNTPQKIAEILKGHGIGNCRAYVCENLGMGSERVTETDLNSLQDLTFSDLNILILIREVSPIPPAPFGLPEDAFRHRGTRKGQITKQEVRAITLARLQLRQDSILWDIGAGSGSVSIGAAHLAPKGKVFAIEKNAADIETIRENVRHFNVSNIEVIEAEAPDGLNNLPQPDAVFIGGTGGKLGKILDAVCPQIKADGRLVMNLVILQNLATASALLEQKGFDVEIVSVNISRSVKMAELTRLEPLTPVFILVGVKNGK